MKRSATNRRDALVSLGVLVLCAGLLSLFTDVELRLVRWVNCGPLASAAARADRISCPDGR
jgi:hypothetical protein